MIKIFSKSSSIRTKLSIALLVALGPIILSGALIIFREKQRDADLNQSLHEVFQLNQELHSARLQIGTTRALSVDPAKELIS